MSRPTFVTWLWNARGGWRSNAGYSPEIIAAVQHMLALAVPGCRHVCISDPEYHAELERRSVEPFPLWETHGRERGERFGFDCHARLGLWGAPGEKLAKAINADVVQWVDADVLIRRTAGPALTKDWDTVSEMFWVPRSHKDLDIRARFGDNDGTWLGVNGSMARVPLGSRPEWWERIGNPAWVSETERYICGSDQAAITRLLLEERGIEWREPTKAIFDLPRFGDSVVPWGVSGRWEVAFFPYDPFRPDGTPGLFTKPWLSDNPTLRQEWRVLGGMAEEAEERTYLNHPLYRRRRIKA